MFFNYFNMSRQSAGIDHFSLISIDPFLITRLEQSHRQLKKKKKKSNRTWRDTDRENEANRV